MDTEKIKMKKKKNGILKLTLHNASSNFISL